MAKFFLFPALIKSVQNCPIASEPLIGCTPGGIKTASLVYSAGNTFPFKLLYAADHSLFAASIAALILSWATPLALLIALLKWQKISPVLFSWPYLRCSLVLTHVAIWPPRLARGRRQRSRCRTAEQRDELAPFHSITSSARAST